MKYSPQFLQLAHLTPMFITIRCVKLNVVVIQHLVVIVLGSYRCTNTAVQYRPTPALHFLFHHQIIFIKQQFV